MNEQIILTVKSNSDKRAEFFQYLLRTRATTKFTDYIYRAYVCNSGGRNFIFDGVGNIYCADRILDNVSGGQRQIIVIAHRLSTIKNCDRIIVMDAGQVAETGTFEQLTEKDGIFAKLVKRQVA